MSLFKKFSSFFFIPIICFQNQSISWNTHDPYVSECFKHLVLVIGSCGVLWIVAPFEFVKIYRYRGSPAPWSVLSIVKIVSIYLFLYFRHNCFFNAIIISIHKQYKWCELKPGYIHNKFWTYTSRPMKQASTYSKTTMRYEMRTTAKPPLTKFGSYLHYHKNCAS